jgi:NADH pyrophosphatase NudC (nudix superfamily)
MLNYTGFKFCPRCASASISDKEGKALHCNSCGFTFYFNPAAAVGCIIETENGLLLVKRARDPGKGTLDLPGGFCDFNESLETAVKREVYEEINITLKEMVYFISFPNTYEYKTVLYHTLDSFFTAKIQDLSHIKLDNEVAGYEFVTKETYDGTKIGFPSVRNALNSFFGIS